MMACGGKDATGKSFRRKLYIALQVVRRSYPGLLESVWTLLHGGFDLIRGRESRLHCALARVKGRTVMLI